MLNARSKSIRKRERRKANARNGPQSLPATHEMQPSTLHNTDFRDGVDTDTVRVRVEARTGRVNVKERERGANGSVLSACQCGRSRDVGGARGA